MKAPSKEFQRSTLVAVNAMGLAAHAIHRGGVVSVVGNDGVIVDSHQAVVTFARVEDALIMSVDPKPERGADGHRARIHMTRSTLLGSSLFDMDMAEIPGFFSESFEKVAKDGTIRWIEHDGDEVCVVHANLQGERATAAEAVDAIGRGIDALTGKASIYVRHPGLGTTPAFDPISDDDMIASVPSEDDPDQDRRAARARIRMARDWMSHLAPAIVVRPLEEEGAYGVWSHAMTIAPPADRSEALRRSIRAYMKLSSMERKDPE